MLLTASGLQQTQSLCAKAKGFDMLQAKKESVKEHCKRINAKLERVVSMQAEWSVPDKAMKADILDQIGSDVLIPYNNFWTAYSELSLLQNPQKHFKYASCCSLCA
jgi:Exo70 exocyst complex subunit